MGGPLCFGFAFCSQGSTSDVISKIIVVVAVFIIFGCDGGGTIGGVFFCHYVGGGGVVVVVAFLAVVVALTWCRHFLICTFKMAKSPVASSGTSIKVWGAVTEVLPPSLVEGVPPSIQGLMVTS